MHGAEDALVSAGSVHSSLPPPAALAAVLRPVQRLVGMPEQVLFSGTVFGIKGYADAGPSFHLFGTQCIRPACHAIKNSLGYQYGGILSTDVAEYYGKFIAAIPAQGILITHPGSHNISLPIHGQY